MICSILFSYVPKFAFDITTTLPNCLQHLRGLTTCLWINYSSNSKVIVHEYAPNITHVLIMRFILASWG